MKPLNEKTLILAHRGACGYAPENTMEAFKLAVEMGADGIELDVHFTADGEVVVCHDEKIDRTSNGQGLVTDYTLAELKEMDFGYHFNGSEGKGITIPTLDEVYELVAPLGMIVNVEIKSANPDIAKACYDIAKKHGMSDRIIYSSFNHFQLQVMKDLDPDARIAPLYNFNMANPWNYAADINAYAIHPRHVQIHRLPEFVKNCHEKGIHVNVWTVNDEDETKFLLEAGVDAIITNYPDVLLNVRDNFGKQE